LPEDGIVFMEDTLFIDCHPYLADGDPDVVLRVLAEVKSLQPSIVVPGHGPVGRAEHLDILGGYIHCLNTLANAAIEQGLPEQDLATFAVPMEYQHFIFPMFFTSNLQFIYQRAKALRKY
jgi:cyclase